MSLKGREISLPLVKGTIQKVQKLLHPFDIGTQAVRIFDLSGVKSKPTSSIGINSSTAGMTLFSLFKYFPVLSLKAPPTLQPLTTIFRFCLFFFCSSRF